MKTWTHYAFVIDGHIENICPFSVGGLSEAQRYGREAFGDECIVIDVTNYRLDFDDTYHDGAFWHIDKDGVEHKREEVPSEEDRIEAVETSTATNTSSIESNTTAIDDILIMLLDDTSTTEAVE